MSWMSKTFIAVMIVLIMVASMPELLKANKPKEPPVIEETYSGNIRELESRKFRNLTEATKVLTVYEVYGHKVLVVENADGSKGSVSVVKLD